MAERTLHRESVLVAAGRPEHVPGTGVNPPIVLASTFHAGGERGYARDGTFTIDALEEALGALDGGAAVTFGSGMAAASAVVEGLPTGSVVVIPASFYNFNRTLFAAQARLGRIEVRVADMTDTAATISQLDGASLAWLEVPSNPLLQVADLPALAAAARERGVRTVVDATVATPLGLRPLEHGADIVLHSATKWLGGHSDLLLGALVAGDPDIADGLRDRRALSGAMPGSLESYLALRGLRTLSVRLERAAASATELARRLAEHPAIRSVHYPGLPDHPQADLAKSLLDTPGALLSFAVESVEAADRLCSRVQLITHATSLGGVESLMERRGAYPGELEQGTPPELVRLSVGIEHVADLWSDLEQALAPDR
jgi:cystathionine gamma-synthase